MAEVASWLPKWKINVDHWFSTQISLVSRSKMSQKSMKVLSDTKVRQLPPGAENDIVGFIAWRALHSNPLTPALLDSNDSRVFGAFIVWQIRVNNYTSSPCCSAPFQSIDILWISSVSYGFHRFLGQLFENCDIFFYFLTLTCVGSQKKW